MLRVRPKREFSGDKDIWLREDVFETPDFPFGVRLATPQTPHKLHCHEGFSEISIVYRGQGTHFTEEGDEYTIRAGDVFVVHGDLQHGYKDLEDVHLANLCFDPDEILLATNHLKKLPGYHVLFSLEPKYRSEHRFESRLRLTPEELTHLLQLVDAIDRELEQARAGFEYTIIALFMQAVSYLCRCYAHTSHLPTTHSLMRIGKVISYLEAHYAEHVDLEALQQIADLSSSALLKNFKDATGVSPIEYLLRVRISRAIELMRNRYNSITDAAFAAGFSDSNYFARQFRRVMNMTPTEYRKRILALP